MQFGHLFAKGDSREAAIRAMVVALSDMRVGGEIHTTIDYAADMLQSSGARVIERCSEKLGLYSLVRVAVIVQEARS